MFRLEVSHLQALTTFFVTRVTQTPHSDHNTVNKSSIGQSIEQCQHPREGTHIHAVEQVRPHGMKKQRTKQ